MLCDDTVECLCSVFRNQENDNEAQNNQSARTRVLLSIFTVKFALICRHSFAADLLTYQCNFR